MNLHGESKLYIVSQIYLLTYFFYFQKWEQEIDNWRVAMYVHIYLSLLKSSVICAGQYDHKWAKGEQRSHLT